MAAATIVVMGVTICTQEKPRERAPIVTSSQSHSSCIATLHSLIDKKSISTSLRARDIGAIMLVESGLKGTSKPSQFTMNFGGESHRFNSKQEALAFLSSRNDTNVDVGCMQINLAAHCQEYIGSCTKESRLRMADELFDKEKNILFATKLLERAATRGHLGYYHSKTPDKYGKYVDKVNKVLRSAGLKGDFR
jgi:hypothetical protein